MDDIIIVDGIVVDKNSLDFRSHRHIAKYYRPNISEEEIIRDYVEIEKELLLEESETDSK